ncbi:Uncharacterised protein [Mycobacteroides abscessus subsp. abscessus]|nr:Uncharacterised protein [Mycobacteroides abscessus subsp. abscessus]
MATISPTSSRVIDPTATSSVVERESGRITDSAPIRSSWPSAGALAFSLARAAARSAASRTNAARSATTKPGVREAISSSCRFCDGTLANSTSRSDLRVAASGRLRPSSRSHSSGPRSRASSASGCAVVAMKATPEVATAVRNSARMSVATGSAAAGSNASISDISSTPPDCRTLLTASRIMLRRPSALVAPASGPSNSMSVRAAQTARASVALPTPAGPDISTPRFGWAPSVLSNSGSSSASLSHSVRRVACA